MAAGVVAGVFGARNAFITVATSDPRALQPYHAKAFVAFGICEVVFVIVAVRGTGASRITAILLALIALYPLSLLLQQAPYVWP
ncbi:MAG TPA: hypothetical protein VGG82_12380 [Casimicrobiaceae bacterium]